MITTLASTGPHIEIKAETLFHLGPIPVTNSMILGLLGYAIVLWLLFSTARAVKAGRPTFLSRLVVMIYETLLRSVEQIIGDRTVARRVAPLAITLFFVIIINYWTGILPFVGPVTYHPDEHTNIPVFRGLVADMNVTFAFAIISMIMVQVYAVKTHGFFGNLGRYLRNPFTNPAGSFEGILELIGEVSRLLALSLRLFGNVFAGEVLLIVVGYMTAYFASVALLPFMLFELFIGSIQAYVFFVLTTVFIALGMVSHDQHSDDHSSAEPKKLAGNDI